MKTIPINEAIELLDLCSAVIVDDSALCYPLVHNEEEPEDDCFLELNTDEFEYRFKLAQNPVAEVENGALVLVTGGEKCSIMLLKASPICKIETCPRVIVEISGGNYQRHRSSVPVDLNIMDHDNKRACSPDDPDTAEEYQHYVELEKELSLLPFGSLS